MKCPPDIACLSDDARVIASSVWGWSMMPTLHFNTPSRIHPRMLNGLKELIDHGIAEKIITKLAGGEKWSFRVKDVEKLRKVKRMSFMDMKTKGFPLTKD